jgi:hypothetical protein
MTDTSTPIVPLAQLPTALSRARCIRRIRLARAANIIASAFVDCTTACRSVGLHDDDAMKQLRDLLVSRGIPRSRWLPVPPVENRDVVHRRVSRWRQAHPERQRALSAVTGALRRRDLARGPCERCGTDRHVCADPVSVRPLLVRWICRGCSAEVRRAAITN